MLFSERYGIEGGIMDNNYFWPQEDFELFSSVGSYNEVGIINRFNTTFNFLEYTNSYKEAADYLVDSLIATNDPTSIDRKIYPLVFMYRHYVELEMKTLYLHRGKLDFNRWIKNRGHDLMRIWKTIRQEILDGNPMIEETDINNTEKYIEQLDDIDKGSFNFRYPFDKNMNPVFNESMKLNIRHLKHGITEIEAFFTGIFEVTNENQ